MNKEIIDLEKSHFSNLHSNFSKFIKKIENYDLEKETLKNIIILNKKFLEINNILDSINYQKKYNSNINEELENYEKNDKAISKFLPYIIYYRMMID